MIARRRIRTISMVAVLATALVAVAGCGSSGANRESATTVSAEKAWARSTATSQTTAAVYLTILNGTGRRVVLTGASVPATIAGSAAMHETVSTGSSSTMAGDSGTSGGSSGDMMTMHEVGTITVQPHETFTFEPGAHHIMLTDLVRPLAAGDEFPITLTRRTGPSLRATVKVRSV